MSAAHLERRALVYVRQSTAMQVHEHGESTQRQYALVERARALGWARTRIEVIDEDQGKSGASSHGRTGFARLAHAVGHGEAGGIFALEVSRLTRASADWQRLLALCAVADVVVGDEQSLYDPADKDDRLLLDLKGTMSEAELHWLRLRLVGGRVNKARRGALRLTAPIGYIWGDGRFALDPDEAVRAAVRVVFDRFAIEPSAWAVVRWARQTGFRFPTRRDVHDAVEWRPLTMGRLNALLHNPIYAGVYAYGRRPTQAVVVEGEIRRRRVRRGPDAWVARIEGAHPAYIAWETYVSNRERLHQNRSRLHGAVQGAPKEGPALLGGLLVCGRCGRRMRVFYQGAARTTWRYVCLGLHDAAQSICWSLSGRAIDHAIETLFLATMVPSEIDLTLAVEREATAQVTTLEAQWQARLEQARYEARRAERRYKAVDPDNRVVARTLEREWEARLQELDDVEQQLAEACRARRIALSTQERELLRHLARDLPALWRAPTTRGSDRKAMLRLVIEAIGVMPVDVPRRATHIKVQWKSGVVDERLIDRPASRAPAPRVLDRMRALLVGGANDAEIAAQLNTDALLGSRLQPWTAKTVAKARRAAGLPPPLRRPRTYLPERHPQTGHYSTPGAARRFGVTVGVIKHWVTTGLVGAIRQRYGRYDARWLVIDEATAARLDALVAARRRR